MAIEISATAELKNNKLHCAQQLQCQKNSPNGIQFILQNGFRFVFFRFLLCKQNQMMKMTNKFYEKSLKALLISTRIIANDLECMKT